MFLLALELSNHNQPALTRAALTSAKLHLCPASPVPPRHPNPAQKTGLSRGGCSLALRVLKAASGCAVHAYAVYICGLDSRFS